MKITKQEENRILELLKSDPERGLKMAMDQFGGTVKWIAVAALGADARQDVEECIAETFVRLWRSAERFDPDTGSRPDHVAGRSSLRSYTCGIARHVAIDMVRRRRKDTGSLEELLERSGEAVEREAPFADHQDFVEQLVKKENRELLWEIVDQLPPPDREIFLMRYWLEIPVKEIGERLSLSDKQVENRLYRGKIALRKILVERGIMG